MLGARRSKSQSAMEYLMTYGWAILAIAIVMVSLYSLGIFNTGSLQPTATPGSCEVVRTAAQTSLAGQCSNLIPKYVASFNGKNSLTTGINTKLHASATMTITAWVNQKSVGSSGRRWVAGYSNTTVCSGDVYGIVIIGGIVGAFLGCPAPLNASAAFALTPNKWNFVAIAVTSSNETIYLNNQAWQGSTSNGGAQPTTTNFNFTTGYEYQSSHFNGSISNVQVYNITLSQGDINTLYQEGIGGVPINLKNLMLWYPLNGNANDYGGNNNGDTPVNITWNANWQTGYTTPTS